LAWLDESLENARAAGRTKTEELLSLVRVEILEEMNSPRQNSSDRGFSTKI
jgi:hypothetical protein